MIKEVFVKTSSRTELVDITHKVEEIVSASNIHSGICMVFVPHTTAGVTINENADPSVQRDILHELNKLIPFDDDYSHTEGNSAAHVKSSIIGASMTMIIENGSLKLGTWQGIYFCEFDGPRNRKVWIKLVKDK